MRSKFYYHIEPDRPKTVILTWSGIKSIEKIAYLLDSRFRGNDIITHFSSFRTVCIYSCVLRLSAIHPRAYAGAFLGRNADILQKLLSF